ncbi:hypothetical protein CC86DRAFT_52253 [Ophiobolus disseminans]|uniref:Uncharacterized protein n=1 Tax=Ophiobolus disseminans TaxID=1469910 RepID=A0A6A6ZTZ5_9PLEO|nr:hypothetical protein CC86DRAFT_52253 [Ophiobolus disseminans]
MYRWGDYEAPIPPSTSRNTSMSTNLLLSSPPPPHYTIPHLHYRSTSLSTFLNLSAIIMANTMDTDCNLPVPMHRPFFTPDPRYDQPLPFRKNLAQVTELTAENSTPYQLSKQRQLSGFERLPFEPFLNAIYMDPFPSQMAATPS